MLKISGIQIEVAKREKWIYISTLGLRMET